MWDFFSQMLSCCYMFCGSQTCLTPNVGWFLKDTKIELAPHLHCLGGKEVPV